MKIADLLSRNAIEDAQATVVRDGDGAVLLVVSDGGQIAAVLDAAAMSELATQCGEVVATIAREIEGE